MSIQAYRFRGVGGRSDLWFSTTNEHTLDLESSSYVVYNGYVTEWGWYAVGIYCYGNLSSCTVFRSSNPGATTFINAGTLYDPNGTATARYVAPASSETLYTRSFFALTGGSVSNKAINYSYNSCSCLPTASANYRFVEWRDGGPSGAKIYSQTGITVDGTTNRITISAGLVRDIDVYAVFEPTATILTVTGGTGGSIESSHTSGEYVTVGEMVTVTATPAYNYTYNKWTGTGISDSAEASYTFPMPANAVNVTASFTARPPIDLTLDAENGEMGGYTLKRGDVNVDFKPPTAGTASSPASVNNTAITVTYTGASDTGGGSLKQVELWASKDGGAWYDTGETDTGEEGSFSYLPDAAGRYSFRLVAEDNDGNRSAAASGAGDCATAFSVYETGNVLVSDSVLSYSSQYSSTYAAAKCVDGSTSTYWRTSSGGSQWAIFRLGSTLADHVISGCSLYGHGVYGVKDFTLQVSVSDTGDDDWVSVLSGTVAPSSSWSNFTFQPVTARRVRLLITSGYSSLRYYLPEITVIGAEVMPESLHCSIGAPDPATTYGDDVSFTIKFTRDVTGFTVDDVTLNKTGTADGTLTGFDGEGDTYTVSVTGISGEGTIGISVAAEVCQDEDEVLNEASNSAAVYTVSGGTPPAADVYEKTIYQDVAYTLNATVTDTALNMFSGWYSGATLLSNLPSYIFTPTTDADLAITAKFAQQPSYAVDLRPTDGSTPYNAGTDTAVAAVCALSIRSPDFEDPDEWLGGNLTVTAEPATGWRVRSWRVQNATTMAVISTVTTTSLTHTFSLSADVIVSCVFEKIPVRITVAVDGPAADAEAGVVAISTTEESYIDVEYGDQVQIEAEPAEGFVAGGWYAGDTLVEETYQHIFIATEDIDFVAKFKATVTLTVSKGGVADGAPEVQIDDGTPDDAEVSAEVIIGETCVIKATGVEPESPAKGSIFDAWYQTADVGFLSPIAGYAEETTITVLDNVALTARFVGVDDLVDRYLAIRNYDNNAQAYAPLIGAVWATGGTEILADEWNAFFYEPSIDPLGTGVSGLAPGDRYFKFTGTKGSVINALPATSVGFMQWTGRYLIPVEGDIADGDPKFTLSDPFVIGTSQEAAISTNQHYVIDAVWGDPVPVQVRLRYGSGSDSTMGSFDMQPKEDRETIQSGIEDMYLQGSVATLSAYSTNGYTFAGWFLDAACTALLSATPEYAFTVSVAIDIYAKFAQDTDAVYEWGGGADNKMMRWRSKRYVATKPFNPSAARVYADAYPATLNLYACSSPESPSPVTPTVSVSVGKQDGMRLPMRRPEKYHEIEVLSPSGVTDVSVSTSMGGLAQ